MLSSALAAYLADRDGWDRPEWANSTVRVASPPWYVSGLTSGYFRDEADLHTPATIAGPGHHDRHQRFGTGMTIDDALLNRDRIIAMF